MADTFYAQSPAPIPTLTVGDLIGLLSQHDHKLPVVFRSPLYGCFGSNTSYTIDTVAAEKLERSEETYPAGTRIDDETGEEESYPAWTDIFYPWEGVVIG